MTASKSIVGDILDGLRFDDNDNDFRYCKIKYLLNEHDTLDFH